MEETDDSIYLFIDHRYGCGNRTTSSRVRVPILPVAGDKLCMHSSMRAREGLVQDASIG